MHVQPGAAAAALPSLTNECYFTSVTESMLPLSLSPQMVARSGFSIESGLDDAIARAGTGPFTSLPLGEAPFEIGGSVAPGYEAVKDAFAANFEKGLERDSQLCIYHKGERVVDIWGSSTEDGVSTAPPEGYNGDTLQIVFSSTKACAAVVFAVAVDRGLFTYDTKVATVWPEFAQEGAWASSALPQTRIYRHMSMWSPCSES